MKTKILGLWKRIPPYARRFIMVTEPITLVMSAVSWGLLLSGAVRF